MMRAIILVSLVASVAFAAPESPTNAPYARSVTADSTGALIWPTNLIPPVVCKGGFRNEYYWYIDYSDRITNYDYTVSVVTNYDLITTTLLPSQMDVDKLMRVEVLRGFPASASIAWSVFPTNMASISQDGVLDMLSSGECTVTANLAGEEKTLVVPLYQSESKTPVESESFTAGSLRYVANTNLDAMIVGGTATWERAYYSIADHATTNYVRNTNCWAAGIDLSGVVVSTSGSTPYWHGTLITSQHIAMAKHAYNGVGSVKRFVGLSGTNYSRTISAVLDPWPGEAWSIAFGSKDIVVGRLNLPLPTNDVCVYSVLPASYTNQTPLGLAGVPCLIFDQLYRCGIGDLFYDHAIGRPSDAIRAEFFSLPYVGDSGRPVFAILPGRKPVLLFLFTYPTRGSSFISNRSAIDAALSYDGATLTDADLSGFTDFAP